jgi:uncharacterized membrane protein
MKLMINPVALLVTIVFLAAFGYSLSAAVHVRELAQTVGAFAVVACVVIELLLTWNPAAWRSHEATRE